VQGLQFQVDEPSQGLEDDGHRALGVSSIQSRSP